MMLVSLAQENRKIALAISEMFNCIEPPLEVVMVQYTDIYVSLPYDGC